MSIRSLTKKGYRIVFEGDCAHVSVNKKTKFVAHTNGKLYEVVLHVNRNAFAGISGKNNLHKFSQSLWNSKFVHFGLGHLNTFDMKKLIDNQMADGMDKVSIDTESKFCESCVMEKQTQSLFQETNARSPRILDDVD